VLSLGLSEGDKPSGNKAFASSTERRFSKKLELSKQNAGAPIRHELAAAALIKVSPFTERFDSSHLKI